MNNLKFRAWYINSKSWWTNSVTISADGKIFVMCVDDKNQFHCFSKSPKDIVIQQFTGFLDKNGKEIYNGDIVKYKSHYGDTDTIDDMTDVVTFSEGKFYPVPDKFDCNDSWYSWKYYDFEVIGNIFENPELLNHEF